VKNPSQIKDASTPGEAVSRRDLLKVGSLSVLGLSLPELFRMSQAEAAVTGPKRAKSCILVFLNGGPSHLDTWDPKPDAPSEYRGEFGAISTKVAGIQLSEHLPLTAKAADKLAIVRSVTSSEGSHERACHYMLTGQWLRPGQVAAPFGSLAVQQMGVRHGAPGYAALPQALRGGSADHLEASYRPVALADLEQRGVSALDVTREPEAIQDRYGRTDFGKHCLQARRLVESGTRFVTVSQTGWDTHGNNFRHLRDHQLPSFDLAFSALVEDLSQRGLLEETLVVCMGEFGRTPRINGYAGRDHWPACHSVVFAGGGVRGGQVIGQSDETGSYPVERPAAPEDLVATIYSVLGVAPAVRPTPVTAAAGQVVRELCA
jgi:uncharacterized protein (DUF1501 family)